MKRQRDDLKKITVGFIKLKSEPFANRRNGVRIVFDVLNYEVSKGGEIIGQTEQIIEYGDKGTLVTALENFAFIRWSDGVTTPERHDIATKNITITAEFPRIRQTYVYKYNHADEEKIESVVLTNDNLAQTSLVVPKLGTGRHDRTARPPRPRSL